MSIVLGFGSIEKQVEANVMAAIGQALASGSSTDDVLAQWNAQADIFDAQPREIAPERYSRIWYYENTVVFHHVNRRHPFSPDGWAMLRVVKFVREPWATERLHVSMPRLTGGANSSCEWCYLNAHGKTTKTL